MNPVNISELVLSSKSYVSRIFGFSFFRDDERYERTDWVSPLALPPPAPPPIWRGGRTRWLPVLGSPSSEFFCFSYYRNYMYHILYRGRRNDNLKRDICLIVTVSQSVLRPFLGFRTRRRAPTSSYVRHLSSCMRRMEYENFFGLSDWAAYPNRRDALSMIGWLDDCEWMCFAVPAICYS